jgi:hypothetical protein
VEEHHARCVDVAVYTAIASLTDAPTLHPPRRCASGCSCIQRRDGEASGGVIGSPPSLLLVDTLTPAPSCRRRCATCPLRVLETAPSQVYSRNGSLHGRSQGCQGAVSRISSVARLVVPAESWAHQPFCGRVSPAQLSAAPALEAAALVLLRCTLCRAVVPAGRCSAWRVGPHPWTACSSDSPCRASWLLSDSRDSLRSSASSLACAAAARCPASRRVPVETSLKCCHAAVLARFAARWTGNGALTRPARVSRPRLT